jgi:hypothetical protein
MHLQDEPVVLMLQLWYEVLLYIWPFVQRPELLELHVERLLAILVAVRPGARCVSYLLCLPLAWADDFIEKQVALLHGTVLMMHTTMRLNAWALAS